MSFTLMTGHLLVWTPLSPFFAKVVALVVDAAMVTGLVARLVDNSLWPNVAFAVGLTGTAIASASVGWAFSGIPGALWLVVPIIILVVVEQVFIRMTTKRPEPVTTKPTRNQRPTTTRPEPITDSRLVGIADEIRAAGGKRPGRTKIQNQYQINQGEARRVVALLEGTNHD
ncbi:MULTISPECIES: hypothetical protein [unclassified Nocardiopsis]|uniref:hypothetical protein n=1 Tax=unclassified Nocardiopsis TaxID=2649073 RepID=UPI0011611772|nr:hypothetical protein [Nocardiopsis sp. TSRI0078]